MMLLLYGYAINFDVRHVGLAVEDRDKKAASRDLVASFVNSTYFDLVADVPAGADLERLTERRIARAVLVIPEGYSQSLAAGRKAQVQLLLDGADANTASTILGYASTLVASTNVSLMLASPAGRFIEPPGIDYEPHGSRHDRVYTRSPTDHHRAIHQDSSLSSTQEILPSLDDLCCSSHSVDQRGI